MAKPADMHFPTHWGSYVTVDDVDAATERARTRGAKVVVEPMDIPGMGRFSGVLDPHGAVIYPYRHAGPPMPEPTGMLPDGSVGWVELLSPDPPASVAFYKEVVGWGHRSQDMGPLGNYDLLTRGTKDVAGIQKMPPEAGGPGQWLVYVMVADVDAAVEKAEKLGGKIRVRGMDIPGVGRIAVHGDPHGATIAFFKPAM
jgi:predicted enzyme related to lactoylglutathione lyase